MHNNSQKMENDARGRRAETTPIDEAIGVPKGELKAVIDSTKEGIKSAAISGVVVNCLKLNVRREPKVNGEIITAIPALTEVVIDMDASSSDFYKVCAATGVEGFCMRKYIALKQ